LLAARFTLQTPVHQPDQALAVQFGHGLHLIQKPPLLLPIGLLVPLLHPAQILVSFVNVHFVFGGHDYLQ
jgi:hypothetical protein